MSYSQRVQSYAAWPSNGRPAAWALLAGDMMLRQGLHCARLVQCRWPWLGLLLRRCVLLVWWSCTLQLGVHARCWLRARRLRRAAPTASVLPLIDAVQAEALLLPMHEQPAVSVIVPSYGKTDYTLRCLASIQAHAPAAPIEVIVVDDAFPGEEIACLQRVRGIQLLRNPVNLGFLRSCNAAAAHARGRWLRFLNNDTEVQPGWLASLVEYADTHEDCGAVGSKLVYPDGTLQEAGGVVLADGDGWNHGKHGNPDDPAYNELCEVDYCSGASLMVRAELFRRFGGFDRRYVRATSARHAFRLTPRNEVFNAR